MCVSLQFLCELPVVGCARFVCGIVGLATIDMSSGVWKILLSLRGRAVRGCLVRLVSPVGLLFQPEKSSWFFVPTYFGGPVPLLVTSSSGDSGLLAALEASDSSSSGDAMADSHQRGRSASTRHIGSDVLLKTASKNCVSSPVRRSASSCMLQPPVASKSGRSLQGLECNFFIFQGCLCKLWVVITKTYE